MKSLTIKNLILIEEAHMTFEPGFTVITGETGAGKTALIEAIRLLMGERADGTKLRKGCEKGLVQGVFAPPPHAQELFEQAGLLWNPDEELLITRELSASGKSRAFVCGQQVPIAFLQLLGPSLVDFIGQHAAISLKSSHTQRHFLDLYGQVDVTRFARFWEEEKALTLKLQSLKEQAVSAEKQKIFLQSQFEELHEADVKEGEFESLFEEYELLAQSREVLSSLQQILDLTDCSMAYTGQLTTLMAKTSRSQTLLQEPHGLATSAHVNLSELHSELQQMQARIESDPQRLLFLEERLKQLNQLKKKYGHDVLGAKKLLEEELEILQNLNHTILATENELASVKAKTESEAEALTHKRRQSAQKLAEDMTRSLRTLNIPNAVVEIEVTPTARSSNGDDEICFWLQANPGEKPALLRDSTSGGELSRLLFGLKTRLATAATLVFDEIDANIGGETATVIGQKLKELGTKSQVLCITHFPQVASRADHHIRVFKEEKKDRTVSRIDLLSPQDKETELLRMLGGIYRKA